MRSSGASRRRPSHPVGQQQSLRDSIDQERAVHRVPNHAVETVIDEPVIFSELQRRRPICSKVNVGASKEPETQRQHKASGDEPNNAELRVCEPERIREDEEQGQNETTDTNPNHQRSLKQPASRVVDSNQLALSVVRHPNRDEKNQPHDEHKFSGD